MISSMTLSIMIFQSTLPHGSDRISCANVNLTANFNPRSLTGATSLHRDHLQLFFISIHAPSRERQQDNAKAAIIDCISIHAPSRERPLCDQKTQRRSRDFNPRSLTGATSLLSTACSPRKAFQSTLPHGSDKIRQLKFSISIRNFNPRSLTGATMISSMTLSIMIFQSTLPHGSDNGSFLIERMLVYFNPRSLTGATV